MLIIGELSAQIFCKPKTALKIKSIKKFKVINIVGEKNWQQI